MCVEFLGGFIRESGALVLSSDVGESDSSTDNPDESESESEPDSDPSFSDERFLVG